MRDRLAIQAAVQAGAHEVALQQIIEGYDKSSIAAKIRNIMHGVNNKLGSNRPLAYITHIYLTSTKCNAIPNSIHITCSDIQYSKLHTIHTTHHTVQCTHRLLIGEAVPDAVAGQNEEPVPGLQLRQRNVRLGRYYLVN